MGGRTIGMPEAPQIIGGGCRRLDATIASANSLGEAQKIRPQFRLITLCAS